jgi:cysteine desulfurase
MLSKPKKNRQVYLDHAATTYADKEVIKAMSPYFYNKYGNPSSLYKIGREANGALNEARRVTAQLIGALPENIIFTGGGTESDNLAIYGIARAHEQKGKHIVSITIEHHAVLYPLEDLKKQGWDITCLKVNKEGFVSAEDVIRAIRPDTVLISIMYANNEIGTVEPIAEIGRKLLQYRKNNNTTYPYFHTDACQASGYLDLNVEKLHVDLMTVNGSKIYGPKGVGMLYVRRGVKIKPIIIGGSQEKKLRAGTENVAGVIGFTKAFELAQKNKEKESVRVAKLRDYLWQRINKEIEETKLNGPEIGLRTRLPNNLNITFQNIEGEAMLLYLDEYGIMCSTGSACTSDSLDPSHVLTAIGLPYEMAHGSLRFSFGKCNTKQDVDYLMKYLPKIVETLREMSPVNIGERKHAKYR